MNNEIVFNNNQTMWDFENAEMIQLVSYIENNIMKKVQNIIDEKDNQIEEMKYEYKTMINEQDDRIKELEYKLELSYNALKDKNNENNEGLLQLQECLSEFHGYSFVYFEQMNLDTVERKYQSIEDIPSKLNYEVVLVGFKNRDVITSGINKKWVLNGQNLLDYLRRDIDSRQAFEKIKQCLKINILYLPFCITRKSSREEAIKYKKDIEELGGYVEIL